jgi:hypothetical protein
MCGTVFNRPEYTSRFSKNVFCSAVCSQNFNKKNKTSTRVHRKHISRYVRFAVFDRDGFRCVFCGNGPKNDSGVILEIDHKVPVCEGGSDEPGNLQTACKDCNAGKAHFKVRVA